MPSKHWHHICISPRRSGCRCRLKDQTKHGQLLTVANFAFRDVPRISRKRNRSHSIPPAFSLSWQFVAPWPFCLSKHRPCFKYFKKSRHQQDSAAITEVWPAFQLPPASEASALLVLLTLAAKDRGREGWLQRPRYHKDSTKAQSWGCWGLLVSMYFYHIFIFICNWLRMNLLNSCWHHPTESAQSLSLRLGAFRCWRTGGRRGAPGDLAPCAAWELPRGRGQRRAAGAGLCRALGWRRRGLRRGIVSVSSRARDLVDERRLGAELRGSLPFVPGWGCVIWECRGRLMCLKCFEVAGCCRRFRVARVFLLAEKSRSRYSPNVSWGFASVSTRLVQSLNECPTTCAGRGIRAWLAETYLATTSVASCNLDPWECRIAWATGCARACKFVQNSAANFPTHTHEHHLRTFDIWWSELTGSLQGLWVVEIVRHCWQWVTEKGSLKVKTVVEGFGGTQRREYRQYRQYKRRICKDLQKDLEKDPYCKWFIPLVFLFSFFGST